MQRERLSTKQIFTNIKNFIRFNVFFFIKIRRKTSIRGAVPRAWSRRVVCEIVSSGEKTFHRFYAARSRSLAHALVITLSTSLGFLTGTEYIMAQPRAAPLNIFTRVIPVARGLLEAGCIESERTRRHERGEQPLVQQQ